MRNKQNPTRITIDSVFPVAGDGEYIPIMRILLHPKFKTKALTYAIAVLLLEHESVNTPAELTSDSYETATAAVMQGLRSIRLRHAQRHYYAISLCQTKSGVGD